MHPSFTHASPRSLYLHTSQEAQHGSAPANAHSHLESEAPPVQSDSLLRGQKVVEIVHNGNLYKLQATKLGKLILTK
jgi:hemin uptake protein HemP